MPEDQKRCVLLGDPHPIILEGLAHLLDRQPDLSLVGQAQNGQETVDLFAELQPDILITERDFPDMDGLTVITTIHENFPRALILVLSNREDEEAIYTALKGGAKGYLFKDTSPSALLDAIRRICAGDMALNRHTEMKLAARSVRPALSPRETQILQQMATGKSNREIAIHLFIAEGTVKSHINTILSKLEVTDRTQAVVAAIKRGLVQIKP